MNQLICDSGGTKSAWLMIDSEGNQVKAFTTDGMNPAVNSRDSIIEALSHLPELIDDLPVDRVWFYGAGCTHGTAGMMQELLYKATDCRHIAVASDMLGAARALCMRSEGIACILGTGANSCYYDGENIQQNTPSLGYILGDEGGGAVLGRILVNRLYKGIFPSELKELFETEMKTDLNTIIENVYRRPKANRYLASFTYFLSAHRDNPHIHGMLLHCFRQFFSRNIKSYNRPSLKVGFVGSLAEIFKDELTLAAEQEGFVIGKVLQSPVTNLAHFHSECGQN